MGQNFTEFYTAHAAQRAAERYGILATAELRGIVRDILDRKAGTTMKRNGDGIGFLYQHKGQRIALVIDPSKRLIVTFLPPDYFNSGALKKRSEWRKNTNRKIPDDFSRRKQERRRKAELLE